MLGQRDKKTLKSLMEGIKHLSVGVYATDFLKAYALLPEPRHQWGKKFTTCVESVNATIRHYLARFKRKTKCYSKSPLMVAASLILLQYKKLIPAILV